MGESSAELLLLLLLLFWDLSRSMLSWLFFSALSSTVWSLEFIFIQNGDERDIRPPKPTGVFGFYFVIDIIVIIDLTRIYFIWLGVMSSDFTDSGDFIFFSSSLDSSPSSWLSARLVQPELNSFVSKFSLSCSLSLYSLDSGFDAIPVRGERPKCGVLLFKTFLVDELLPPTMPCN